MLAPVECSGVCLKAHAKEALAAILVVAALLGRGRLTEMEAPEIFRRLSSTVWLPFAGLCVQEPQSAGHR